MSSRRGAGRIFGRALDQVKKQDRQGRADEESWKATPRTRVQEEPQHRNEPRWQQEGTYSRQRKMPPVRQEVRNLEEHGPNNVRPSLQDSSTAQETQRSQESHQTELKPEEENCPTELANEITKAKQELSDLQTQWEARGKTWAETRRQLVKAFESNEKSWKEEIDQLRGLLKQREAHISRVEREQRTQNGVHRDTLALLTRTQAALKEQQQQCASLKDECSVKLAEQEHRHQAELQKNKERFQELTERNSEAERELSGLQTRWEAKEEAWGETRRQLEETLQKKETVWGEEVGQLQERLKQREQNISRVQQEQREHSVVHLDTLALLSSAQAAFKEQQQQCAALKEEHSMKLAEQERGHREEVKLKEERFQSEVCQHMAKAEQELSGLQTQWEAKEEACGEIRRELEEKLQKGEETWQQKEAENTEEIQLLHKELVQLQQLIAQKEKKRKRGLKMKLQSLCCWRPKSRNGE